MYREADGDFGPRLNGSLYRWSLVTCHAVVSTKEELTALNCSPFANDAVERDENATHRGKIDIERWASETIDKYKFHFRPLSAEHRANETVVSIEVSGSFPGSSVTLNYHFSVVNEKISSLIIDS